MATNTLDCNAKIVGVVTTPHRSPDTRRRYVPNSLKFWFSRELLTLGVVTFPIQEFGTLAGALFPKEGRIFLMHFQILR